MARTRKSDADVTPEPLGKEGEVCAQCGTKLAVDQRYCLNCGMSRAEPRLDYERHLRGQADAAEPQKARGSTMQWSPLLAIVAIAILGVMLLLGVLIGQDDSDVTVTEVPASTAASTTPSTTATTAPTTTETFPTDTVPTETTVPTTPGTGTEPHGIETNPQGSGANGAGGLSPND